ncbi:MAG: anhydro-N-acetylmuramic acid kinase [Pseudomonadaceae bacterium]|nr:MAG: anhydro-N-acetylmuramic acid kinase [Pseudomonadaceae bacterium]
MSGTSLDGIDLALTRLHPEHGIELVDAECLPFSPELHNELKTLCQPGSDEIRRAGLAGQAWAERTARGIHALLARQQLKPEQILAIGSHGQTIRHHPELGFSVQIGAPALLAERCRIQVVSDFRSRDLAAGGEGAPLVPAFHQWLLEDPEHTRAVINIGGFANLTLLRPGQTVVGFDSGPGNILLDAWIQRHQGQAFDKGGRWAASGTSDLELVSQLLADPYFSRSAPKSTGREYFNAHWLEQQLQAFAKQLPEADVQASLLELTAQSIATALDSQASDCRSVYICGGGAANIRLLERLSDLLSPLEVHTTAAVGVDPDWMEAMAFAWLAWRCLQGQSGNLPAVTGASGPRVLGAVYPG